MSGPYNATFVYDGDGNRVKGTVGSVTSHYIGSYFEWKTNTSDMVSYYYDGNTSVAMRTGSTLNYLLGDHPSLTLGTCLGSQAITTDSNGNRTGEIRYMPWGTERYTWGTTPTTYNFTGQRVEASLGLLFYNARWYDASLGRFIQADSVVPGGVQGLDRYAYVGNNPLNYIDPTGNATCDDEGHCWLNGQATTGVLFGIPPNNGYVTLPNSEPWGLTADGVAAFSGMTYLQAISDDPLSSEKWLTYIIDTEYLSSLGADPAWNAAMARRYQTYCGGGPFTSSCFNGFWGYMQKIRKNDITPDTAMFTSWVLAPNADYQINIQTASNIAFSIQHPSMPNIYGINSSMTSCDGHRCDWVTISPVINGDPGDPNSFYSYIKDLSSNNNWIYTSGDSFDLLLTVNQIIGWFGRYPYNMTSVTEKP